MNVVGLFSGIGGFELGFARAGFDTILLCENDASCKSVLRRRLGHVPLQEDVLALKALPDTDVLLAGFPCQPFSQAGRTKGLVESREMLHAVIALIERCKTRPRYVVLENVPNIVHLDRGEALRFITRHLEGCGYTWAYRILDTSSFGLPQRRRRWFFVASLDDDAPSILLSGDAGTRSAVVASAHGFYWTEGNRGLGWADDAIPPLKSGSGLGIPSPPAIWIRQSRKIVTPTIADAEALQGFPAGWTVGHDGLDKTYERKRWRMVGNAVSVPAAQWIAQRICSVASTNMPKDTGFKKGGPWPRAAWGRSGERYAVDLSAFPIKTTTPAITDFLREVPQPLSARATRGFRIRLEASCLRYPSEFMDDLLHHEQRVSAS